MVDITAYDIILINSSAGKDSLAVLDHVVKLADAAGVLRKVVVVHCDLGRVEWAGTRDLAQRQAERYGVRFEVVKRDRDLLHQLEHERFMWPDMARRWCTSDQKTAQVKKLMTKLVREKGLPRRVRILNVLGIRADESPKRAKMAAFSKDEATNLTKRDVDRWYPIHEWSADQVWAYIRSHELEYHPAYDLGMPRLSCVFCVFASEAALTLAAQHNPELGAEYARIEIKLGHKFRRDLSIADVVEKAASTTVTTINDWAA